MSDKYDFLKKQYPECVSINQFSKTCHMAKRSAVYLLAKGIVPYCDTGKKTWKYKIRLCDVISYLVMREQDGSKIPRGAVPNRNKKRRPSSNPRLENFFNLVKPHETKLVRKFFEQNNPECPGLLTASQISKLTGLEVNMIRKKIRLGELRAFISHRTYYIPKPYFFEFLQTPGFLCTASHSETFRKNLDLFAEWKMKIQQMN